MGFLSSVLGGFGKFLSSTGIPGIKGLGEALGGQMETESERMYQREVTESERRWQEKMTQQANEWNLAQWHRENEYNDPSQQMARLTKAGVNADIAFGNGAIQNIAAHSPFQSNIGSTNVPNVGALRVSPLESAQIAAARAQAEKTEEEAEAIRLENNLQKDLREIGFDGVDFTIPDEINNSVALQNKLEEFKKVRNEANVLFHESGIKSFEEFMKSIDHKFHESYMQSVVDELRAKADISIEDARNYARTLAAQIAGFELDNDLKSWQREFATPEFILKVVDHLPVIGKMVKGLFGKKK